MVTASSFALAKPCKVFVEKNKKLNIASTSEILHLNRGDQIRILKVEGCGKELTVTVHGRLRPESELPVNDMDQLIDTAYDLQAIQYKQKKFSIEIFDATQKLIARLHAQFLEPELFYLVLSSAGSERIARNGDTLELLVSEKIKVLRVETNLIDKKLLNIEFKSQTDHISQPKRAQSKIVQMLVKYQNFKVATIDTRIINP